MDLITIPENQLLDMSEDQLEALAYYNLLILDVNFSENSITPEHIKEQYEKLIAKISG